MKLFNVPFSDEAFMLSLSYANIMVGDAKNHTLRITRNFFNFHVLINPPHTSVSFIINFVFERSHLILLYQAKNCDGIVTVNHVTLSTSEQLTLPNEIPYLYNSLEEILEYHVLVTAYVGQKLEINYNCSINWEKIKFHDWPSPNLPLISARCSEFGVATIEATTFQVYIIYKHRTFILDSYSLTISKYTVSSNRYYKISIGETLPIKMDYRNTSHVIYESIDVNSHHGRRGKFHYNILISLPMKTSQGYRCQYIGVVIYHNIIYSPHSMIGPVCTHEYAELLKDVTFTVANYIKIDIYSYGPLYLQLDIHFPPPENQNCISVINPCFLCELIIQPSVIIEHYRLFCEKGFAHILVRSHCRSRMA
jgi:hypothetical protein